MSYQRNYNYYDNERYQDGVFPGSYQGRGAPRSKGGYPSCGNQPMNQPDEVPKPQHLNRIASEERMIPYMNKVSSPTSHKP